jgi:hypothetical protein
MTNDKNMRRGSTGWRVVLLEAIQGTKISFVKRKKKYVSARRD